MCIRDRPWAGRGPAPREGLVRPFTSRSRVAWGRRVLIPWSGHPDPHGACPKEPGNEEVLPDGARSDPGALERPAGDGPAHDPPPVSYTHLRAHETGRN